MFQQCISNIYNAFTNNSQNWLCTDFNEDDCVDRLHLTFSFIRGSLCIGLLKRFSVTRPRRCITQSYLTSISYSHNTVSLVYYILHFGRSKMYICGFNDQMHLHMSSFILNAAQTSSWSGLSDRIYITKGMKWPGVNSPYIYVHVIFH